MLPSFIRLARISTRLRHARIHYSNRHRQPFFQASFPYLNTSYYYQGLLKRHEFFHKTRWWSRAETGSTSQSTTFPGIADGHYGVYYSMYNHECERKDRQRAYENYIRRYMIKQMERGDRTKFKQCVFMNMCKHHHHHHHHHHRWSKCGGGHRHRWNHRSHKHYRGLFHVKLLLLGIAARFIISKAIKDTQIGLENVKTATYRLTSSCYVKPAGYFINAGASFHSSSLSSSRLTDSRTNGDVFSIGLSRRSFTTVSQTLFQQLTKTSQKSPTKVGVEDSFENGFLESQIANITNAFENYGDKKDLDIIYPLYQSIKRNGLTLPSVELYNMVLKSIIDRFIDNEVEIGAIERKLTNLLTVYQDILYANLKPDDETYNLVVNAMLDSTLKCSLVQCENYIEFNEISTKSKEFAQIAFELVESSSKHVLFKSVFDKVVKLSKLYPGLVSELIVGSFVQMLDKVDCDEPAYCLNVLELSSFLSQLESYDEKQAYTIIGETYKKISKLDNIDEYAVYQSLINALVYNSQLSSASQLLDNILMDYKESLQFSNRPSKAKVSCLIAAFLKAYAVKTNAVDSLELLKKFQHVPYLPELPIWFYNFIIVKLQEFPDRYDDMWALYNRVALRKDFQSTSTIDMMKDTNGLSCRDVLLGLAICKGDHERVFQLVKEIMLKEHLIGDSQVLRMVLDYLNNGVVNNRSQGEYFNQYYLGLLHLLLLIQAKHYQTSTNLNDFVSEFVQYLTISVPSQLAGHDMALASISNYNVQLLMNSPIPIKCVESFDLQSDNLYGLNVIARHLLQYAGADPDISLKVADFEAHLINQFEDPGNHYLELTNDIVELKNALKTHFTKVVANLNGCSTPAIDRACQYLNLVGEGATESVKLSIDQDLSYLLNINYEKGVAAFIELFGQGYTFDVKTWNALLNYKFVNEYLPRIDVASMLDRMWMTGREDKSKLFLLDRLIAYNDQHVNGEVLAFLVRENIFFTKLLTRLFQSSVGSSISEFNFELIYLNNSDVEWVTAYFNYLKHHGYYEEIKKCSKLVHDKSEELKMFELEAELETNPRGFSKLVETLQVAPDNTKLVELQIKHELKSGVKASDILSRDYPSNSPQVIESLSFVRFLDSLQQHKFEYARSNFVSLDHMASSLLACGNLQQMKYIIENNAIEDASKLVSSMLRMLIDAVPHATAKSIINRLMVLIKFYKLLSIGSIIPVEQFLQIITLLKLTKSDLLSVLTNRIIMNRNGDVGGVISNIVNFYFLEVQLFDKESKQLVYNCLGTN